MELLSELFNQICHYANISSLRIISRTNRKFYKLGQRYVNEKQHSYYTSIPMICPKSPLEEFTLELAVDGFDVPMRYYVEENRIICPIFAYLGQLDLLKRAISETRTSAYDILEYASAGCQIKIIEYFGEKTEYWTGDISKMVLVAAKYGHLDVITYLYRRISLADMERIIDLGIKFGHLNIVQWGIGKNYLPTDWKLAAEHGHLHILKWGTEEGFIDVESMLDPAVSNAHIDIIEWIVGQGYSLEGKHYGSAIFHRHASAIKWMLSNDSNPPIKRIQKYATQENYTDIFQLLVDHGYVIDEDMFRIAAIENSYDVMKWMIKRGILTKRIHINTGFDGIMSVMKSLLKRDLVLLDNLSCVKLIQSGYISDIEHKLSNIPKSPYHFFIANSLISDVIYDATNHGTGQKLFHFEKDGQVNVTSLEDCNCWWHLLACVGSNDCPKLKGCDLHKYII